MYDIENQYFKTDKQNQSTVIKLEVESRHWNYIIDVYKRQPLHCVWEVPFF